MLLAPFVIQVSEFIVKSGHLYTSYCFKMSLGNKNISVNVVEMISMTSI